MKEENEINREVKQLLDSLEQHGQNARRQQELIDLIDKLASGTSLRHRLIPLWWVIGTAAACLLLWLLVKPTVNETPKVDEKILVEETKNVDSTPPVINDEFLEEPAVEEELTAVKTTIEQSITETQTEESKNGLLRYARNDGREDIAEATPKEPSDATGTNDTMNIGSNTILTSAEEKLSTINCQLSTNSSPQRRVIRSLNLVCYECQKAPESNSKLSTLNSQPEKTIFGQPQDPNMKNGSLAFELKLH